MFRRRKLCSCFLDDYRSLIDLLKAPAFVAPFESYDQIIILETGYNKGSPCYGERNILIIKMVPYSSSSSVLFSRSDVVPINPTKAVFTTQEFYIGNYVGFSILALILYSAC